MWESPKVMLGRKCFGGSSYGIPGEIPGEPLGTICMNFQIKSLEKISELIPEWVSERVLEINSRGISGNIVEESMQKVLE